MAIDDRADVPARSCTALAPVGAAKALALDVARAVS